MLGVGANDAWSVEYIPTPEVAVLPTENTQRVGLATGGWRTMQAHRINIRFRTRILPRMASKLTDVAIRNAKPRTKKFRISAGQGLTLLVMPNGSQYGRLRYE